MPGNEHAWGMIVVLLTYVCVEITCDCYSAELYYTSHLRLKLPEELRGGKKNGENVFIIVDRISLLVSSTYNNKNIVKRLRRENLHSQNAVWLPLTSRVKKYDSQIQ